MKWPRWKCFVQTHFLSVTIFGLMWSSSVTFKHKMNWIPLRVLGREEPLIAVLNSPWRWSISILNETRSIHLPEGHFLWSFRQSKKSPIPVKVFDCYSIMRFVNYTVYLLLSVEDDAAEGDNKVTINSLVNAIGKPPYNISPQDASFGVLNYRTRCWSWMVTARKGR